jgi:L-2-hydroxyglutarate oxidase LhgO
VEHDVIIVGGGIIGLATAKALLERFPGLDLVVLEKEPAVGRHQSGRNSGVLHSGLYYKPGSLKAKLCLEGAAMMVEFCQEHGVPFTRDGKVVVAVSPSDRPGLDELERRGTANGVKGLRRIGGAELRQIEPNANGSDALAVAATGAVDFAWVTRALAAELTRTGAQIQLEAPVQTVARHGGVWRVGHGTGDVAGRVIVNCAGLYSDRLARRMGVIPPVRIVPFRGEYLTLRPEARHFVNSSIYPVPDPALPFLGVHLTRRSDGTVEAGPNAVPAFAREGYSWSQVRPGELWDALSYAGTWRLAQRHWRSGYHEVARSLRRRLFVRDVQRLVPGLSAADFTGRHAGVRAQALTADGLLADDFVILETEDAVHVLNAPSPAATASLAIGQSIAGDVGKLLPPRSR